MSSLDDIIGECQAEAAKHQAAVETVNAEQTVCLVIRLPPGHYDRSRFEYCQNMVRQILDSQGCKMPVLVIDHNIDVFAVSLKDIQRPS